MVIGEVTLELHRVGNAAKLNLRIMKHGLEASVTLPELESITLYLASEVGKWRDAMIEIEEHTQT